MDTLYNKVKEINSLPILKAKRALFGFEGISIDTEEYYQRIITTFTKKKDYIIKQESGKLIFDLENINDLWSIVFIANYLNNELEKKISTCIKEINKLDEERNNLINNAKSEGKNIQKELKQKYNKIKIIKKQLEKINKCKESFVELRSFPYTIEFTQNAVIKEDYSKRIKESIKSIHILRNIIEHGNSINKENNIEINNYDIELSIPISYLEGFNAGRIIAKEKDEIIVEKTNEKVYPVLEEFDYDIGKLESFFYNVDPSHLKFILELCDNKTENLYKIPPIFFNTNSNLKKMLLVLLKVNKRKKFQKEDYDFLNYIKDFISSDKYTFNLLFFLYRFWWIKYNPSIDDLKNIAFFSKIATKANLWLVSDRDTYIFYDYVEKYLEIKKKYSFASSVLDFEHLPVAIFNPNFKNTDEFINYIVIIKMFIQSEENRYKKELNKIFNKFIEDYDFLLYLKDIIDIISNSKKYEQDQNQHLRLLSMITEIVECVNIKKPKLEPPYYSYISENKKQERIKDILKKYKNNSKISYVFQKNNNQIEKTSENEKINNLITIIKQIKKENISFEEYINKTGIDECKKNNFFEIKNFEEEINYLLEKTNNNYQVTIKLILKLSKQIVEKTLDFKKKYYNSYMQKSIFDNIKNYFKYNVDKMLSKYSPEDLVKFPSEMFYIPISLFNSLYEDYNINVYKSIFGIENPKLIAVLIYANSVLSKYNKENMDNLDIESIIHKCFNETNLYCNNNFNISMNQEIYLKQFLLNDDGTQKSSEEVITNFINKIRNSVAHFRFRPVKNKDGKILTNKVYLYDKYIESENNNFNIVIELSDLIEIIRKIEESLENKIRNSNTDYEETRINRR